MKRKKSFKNLKSFVCLAAALILIISQLPQASGQCSSGQYWNGSSCNWCSAGTYGDGTNCNSCSCGSYSSSSGWGSCSACGAGTRSTSSSGSTGCTNCNAGQYSSGSVCTCSTCSAGQYSSAGSSGCSTCSAGQYSSAGSSGCSTCPAGQYSSAGSSGCSTCSAGQYSSAGSGSCSNCGSGTYSDAGSSSCTTCPPGYYCPSTNVQPIRCRGGYYSGASSTSCTQCPAGSACPDGQSSPISCPSGFYSPAGSSQCFQCPAGRYCSSTSSYPSDCTAGYYSYYGSSSCTQCPKGYYCPRTDSGPVICPDGYWSSAGSTTCSICDAGYQCTNKYTQSACSAGTYSYAGDTNCRQCPGGFSCPSTSTFPVACASGYYSAYGASSCTQCSAGTYCPPYAIAAITCPSGSYSSGNGWTQCKRCPAGYQCSNAAVAPVACSAGQYSYEMSTSCTNCPAGYSCKDTYSPPAPCPHGWYASSTGSTSCTICPAGSYCTKPSSSPTACASGYYSMAGWTQCNVCPIGYICPNKNQLPSLITISQTAALGQTAATTCSAGSARSSGGTCVTCPSGYTSVGGNSIRCVPCPPGYECTSGSATPNKCTNNQHAYWMTQNCQTCTDPDQQCMYRERDYIEPCPHGTYMPSSNTNSLMCLPCPAGSSCHQKGSSTTCTSTQYSLLGEIHCHSCPVGASCTTSSYSLCSAGSYSGYGVTTCSTCPVGYFCPDIFQDKQPCPPGTYQDTTGSIGCKVCALGYYSSAFGSSSCTQCPAGSYCQNADQPAIICPFGTYSTAGSVICLRCTDGYLCESGETTPTPSGKTCANGWICNPARQLVAFHHNVPCPPGYYYLSATGSSRLTSCQNCPAGSYCPAGTASPIACLAGYYCPLNTKHANEYPCPKGTFNSATSGTSLASCSSCTAGKYCPGGTSTPFDCPPGTYCPLGTGEPQQSRCPGGTYSGDTALSAVGGCTTCTAGFYCPVGSVIPLPCPPGTVNPSTGKQYIYDCVLPTAGTRATTWGNPNAAGDACTAGYYCPIGMASQYPCPAGTYTDSTSLTKSSDCTPCPAGYACEEGTGTGTKAKLNCAAGYYCPLGTKQPYTYKCPAGTYSANTNNQASTDCTSCTAGYYCLEGTVTPVYECPKGYYCPAGTQSSYQYPCASGTYGSITKLKASSECFVCPAGYYCEQASTAPVVCPVGTYAPTTGYQAAYSTVVGVKACLACPSGQTCATAGTVTTTTCGTGKYSYPGTTDCLTCKAGHYCPDASTTSTQHDNTYICPAGYLCPEGTPADPTTSGNTYKCAMGYYCLQGATAATACLAGTYNDVLGGTSVSSCKQTPAGYYTGSASTTQGTQCSAGYYCPAGSTSGQAMPCPAGTIRATVGAGASSDCSACTAGYICGQGTAIATICPQGYYCPSGSSTGTQCPVGTYGAKVGLTASTDCQKCLPGMYCSQKGLRSPDGLCDIGYYCVQGATTPNPTDGTLGNVCVAGGFCDLGSFESVTCKPGTFRTDTKGTSEADCTACTPGQYCSGTFISSTQPCTAGYYCSAGSTIPTSTAADKGYYSLAAASTQTACATGTYNPLTGQSTCVTCLAGYYCDVAGLAEDIKDCPTGNYCPAGSNSPTRCPIGTYNDLTNGIAVTDCKDCPSGKYCSSEGLSAPAGTCTAGYYCKTKSQLQAAETADPVNNYYGPCPVGHYCPAGTGEPIKCPPGTYNPANKKTVVTDCIDCTAGTYCADSGRSTDGVTCAAGYFCVAKSTQYKPASGKCTAGNKCPAGSGALVPCPAGTYQDQGEQADCITCPAGYFCASGASSYSSNVCSAGYYCPAGTSSATANACPAGTYNPNTGKQSINDCKACKPGYYCATTGLSAPTGQCDAGYYCTSGSTTKTPPNNSETKFNICKAGNYCPTGSAYQIPCDPGKACPNDKMADTDMLTCQAGYYCPLGSTSIQQVKCPAAHYCVAGVGVPYPCPRGTFSAATGLTALSQCSTCSVGSYCEKAALTAPTGSCASGYYCKNEHYVARPSAEECPAGYYCGVGSVDKTACTTGYQDTAIQSTCKNCPIGFYCPQDGSSLRTSKVMCDPSSDANNSFYCPDVALDKTTCGAGKYSLSKFSQSLSTDCDTCPPGFYCANSGSVAKFVSCPAGAICAEGTSASTGSATCLPGYYCPAGYAVMVPCTPGKYCSTSGLSAPTGDCSAGYYCKEGATSATPTDGTTGNKCPLGSYCPAGSTTPTACPIGTYLDEYQKTQSSDCKACPTGKVCRDLGLTSPSENCPEGYYCPFESGIQKKYPCPPGFRCPAGVNDKINCLSGTYQYLSNKGTCYDCPARYYCSKNDADNTQILSSATICPAGKYCGLRTSTPTDCPAGTYSAQTGLSLESECEDCPAGYYCIGGKSAPDGQCQAGYYCLGKTKIANPTDTITGNICPVGNYCPAGTYQPVKCPKGTINDLTGKSAVGDCTNCQAGFYCPYLGATSSMIDYSSNTHKCDAGYICLGGSARSYGTDGTIAKACSAGKYCPKGATVETSCPLGTYNPLTASGDCFPCPKGKVCDSTGMTAPNSCPAGYYCPLGSSGTDNKVQCPAGTFSNDIDLSEVAECSPCPTGKYCPIGTTDPSANDCDAGYFCVKGSGVKNPSTDTYTLGSEINGKCPQGYYCLAGTVSPTPCPIGTYNPSDNKGTLADCVACPAGRYCDEMGIDGTTINSKLCTQGYLCISGSTTPTPSDGTKGKRCDPGYYCLQGATSQVQCPAGSYEPRDGTYSSSCQTCPAGYYCPLGATTPTICPILKYCPAGSGTPTVCPNGRYNDDQTGLEASTQCKECTSGYYCQNGAIVDRCTSGYFCDTGATALDDSNKACPVGYYCPDYTSADCKTVDTDCNACADSTCQKQKCCLFPIRCPDNYIRTTTGAKVKTDCTVCPNGYYCLSGSNTKKICPRGFYCVPGATQKVTPCPEGTANSIEGKYASTDCLACGTGYLCNKKGIGDKENFLCPLGYYCPQTQTTDATMVKCPAGTYRDTIGAKVVTDCPQCPAGYYCPINTINPIPCIGGTYCPAGSSTMTDCPAGKYCHEKFAAPVSCPEAFYCPAKTDIYIKCRNHYYCPLESTQETPCPAGKIGWGNPNNKDIPTGCTECPAGTYSTIDTLGDCPICPQGYVCLGDTNSATPTDTSANKGYECQAGYYCPAGSSSMTSCPAGTYNPSKKQYALTHCLSCPAQTFSSTSASTSCTSCGSTSKSTAGSTTCSCIGNNRKYLATSKICVCIDRYTSATSGDSQSDSSADCSTKLVSNCPDTTDTSGNCVSTTESCYTTCGSSGGTRYLGMCDCKAKTLTNDVCNSSCRSSRNTFSISATGDITITTTSNTTTTLTMSSIPNLQGSVTYSSSGSSSNTMINLGLSSNSFTANYEASSYFKSICTTCNAARRNLDGESHRDLASSGSLSNPVVCVSVGTSILFDVNSSTKSYPVYVSDSLLNTNTNFDYGSFLSLASTINSGTSVSQFIFQFTTSGVYVFQNSIDTSQQMVLAVMGSGSKCPDSSSYINPMSLKSLLLVGASQSSVVYEPNWVFICLLIVGIIVLIGILIGVYYYMRRSWLTKIRRNIRYRKVNLKGEDLPSIRDDNACFDYMQRNKDERISNRMRQKMNREIRYSEIEDLRIRLKNHIDKLKGNIFGDLLDVDYTKDIEININKTMNKDNIMLELQKLKDLIMDHKKNIEGEFDEKYSDDEQDPNSKNKDGINFLSGINANKKKMEHDIVHDGNKQDDDELNKMMMQIQKRKEKIDKDINGDFEDKKKKLNRNLMNLDGENDEDMRKKLLEELNDKLERVDNTLKDEEMAQMNALESKLAQRKKRRGKIVDNFNQLQKEKEDLTNNSALRNEIDRKCENKIDEMEDDLEKEREEGLKIIQDNINMDKHNKLSAFESKLKKATGDKKNFDKYLEEYTKAEKGIQEELRREQMEQEKKLNDELKRRRDARLARIEADKGQMIEDAKQDIKERLRDLEEKERAFEGLQIKELDPFLKDIVKKSEQKVGNKRELDMLRSEADDALAKYRDAEAAERDRIRKELMEKYKKEDDEENNEVLSFRERLLKEILDKEEEKESQLAKFKKQLEQAPTAEEKQSLINQHDNYKQDMEKELQKMAEDGTQKLEQRLRDRRAKRRKEEEDLLKQRMEELDKEKEETEDQHKKNIDEVRENLEEKTIEEIVRGLQSAIAKEEVPSALEKILDDRQMKELMELLMRQYKEKAQAMKDALIKMLNDKIKEIDDLNKEISTSRKFLRDAYEKGGITEDSFNEEMKKLKKRQTERLDEIDAKYNNLEMDAERDIRRRFIDKHTNEQIELEELHIREREKFFSKLLPESAMKRILEGLERNDEARLNDFINDKNEEKEARIRELDEMMANLRSEMDKHQKELDDLDEYERMLKEKELNAARRFEIQKQKLIEQKKREQEAELIKVSTKDQREEMIKKHLEELEELQRILDAERKRQLDIHRKMFEEKRSAIEERKKKILQEKMEEEARRKQKQMEEEERTKKEMSDFEKKRQEKMTKLQKDVTDKLVLYDKPAYSTPIDWSDRTKFRREFAGDVGGNDDSKYGQKITKEEKIRRKIERIQKSNKGPMSLELLARIIRLEEIVTDMTDKKYSDLVQELP